MMGFPAMSLTYLALQGLEFPSIQFPYLGTRGLVGIVMLIHIFFATLFVGYALGSPLLQAWSVRSGNPHFERLAHSMARFNLLTFSIGATGPSGSERSGRNEWQHILADGHLDDDTALLPDLARSPYL